MQQSQVSTGFLGCISSRCLLKVSSVKNDKPSQRQHLKRLIMDLSCVVIESGFRKKDNIFAVMTSDALLLLVYGGNVVLESIKVVLALWA